MMDRRATVKVRRRVLLSMAALPNRGGSLTRAYRTRDFRRATFLEWARDEAHDFATIAQIDDYFSGSAGAVE
jgi:hypothetical protein